MERHNAEAKQRLRLPLLVVFGMLLMAVAIFTRSNNNALQPASRVVTVSSFADVCATYSVALPAPVSADLMDQANEAIELARTYGTRTLTGNATFMAWMKKFTVEDREYIFHKAGSPMLYQGTEVTDMKAAEEAAVLSAAPLADLTLLNGLNVGAGGRGIHPTLIALDAHRGLAPVNKGEKAMPASQRTTAGTMLAWANNLPFAPNSIDYIVSLHNLEHLHDPVATVAHYLDILKPGGGLGVVIPHWQFAWDARHDANKWGHRWNTAPEVVCSLYHQHWADVAILERLSTLPFRLSFDFVLRKRGTFEPFDQDPPAYTTGQAAYCDGSFIGPHDMPDVEEDRVAC